MGTGAELFGAELLGEGLSAGALGTGVGVGATEALGAGALAAGAGAGAEALSGVEAINSAAPGSIAMGLTDSQIAADPFISNLATGAAGGAATGAGGGGGAEGSPGAVAPAGGGAGSFLTADSPMMALTSDTANALGISGGNFVGDLPLDTGAASLGVPGGGSAELAGGLDVPTGSFDASGMPDYSSPPADPSQPFFPPNVKKILNELGLSPATAAMLGISGAQALGKPAIPEAAKTLSGTAGPGAAEASGVIQSGGTSGPAWATQKASIDATIDQQIQQQMQALVQQAINSGQGADSQVVQQQGNKLKNDLETKRQQLYAEAQSKNVQAALTQLGISDQALSSVAAAQFKGSDEAKSAAAQTASNAMMLQALSKQQPAATGA